MIDISPLGFAEDFRIGCIKNGEFQLSDIRYLIYYHKSQYFANRKTTIKNRPLPRYQPQTIRFSRHEWQNVLVQNTSYYIIIRCFSPDLLQWCNDNLQVFQSYHVFWVSALRKIEKWLTVPGRSSGLSKRFTFDGGAWFDRQFLPEFGALRRIDWAKGLQTKIDCKQCSKRFEDIRESLNLIKNPKNRTCRTSVKQFDLRNFSIVDIYNSVNWILFPVTYLPSHTAFHAKFG